MRSHHASGQNAQMTASTGGSAVKARSVEEQASGSTGGDTLSTRSVEGATSVSTGGSAVSAKSVGAAASVSMVGAQGLQGVWRAQRLPARAAPAQAVQGMRRGKHLSPWTAS